MVICKSPAELEKMHRAGLIVWGALEKMRAMVRPGISTKELDEFAEAYTAEAARAAGVQGLPGISGFGVHFDQSGSRARDSFGGAEAARGRHPLDGFWSRAGRATSAMRR